MTFVYALLVAILGVCSFAAWKLATAKNTDGTIDAEKEQLMQDFALVKANLEKKSEEVGELKSLLETERNESHERKGKMKNIYDATTKLEAKFEAVSKERDELKRLVTKHEAQAQDRETANERRISELARLEQALKEERQRVIREDEERMRQLEEERDRLWANHEIGVVAALTDLCKQPAFSFTSYTNTNLPDGFDGSLKPDFMIDFLGQYVIFDAKVSKAKSMQTYITSQIKSTVEKVKGNDQIYKSIFLVVPTSALAELKTHHHIVEGYNLYIIGPEAVAPILASLKRISMYEFAEQMDPEQRENIVQLIAELDFHINLRNAADLILTKMGTDLLQKAQKVDPELAEEVALKKAPMNAKASIAAGELKKIVSKLTNQIEEAQQLISPRAPVRKKDLEEAQGLLADTLL